MSTFGSRSRKRPKRPARNNTGVLRGSGSVDQLPSGRFRARVIADGKRVAIGTFADEQEAVAALGRVRRVPIDRCEVTWDAFAGEWLALKRPDLAPRTYVLYEGLWRNHLRPHLGPLLVAGTEQADIARWWKAAGAGSHISRSKSWRLLASLIKSAEVNELLYASLRAPAKNAGSESSAERPLLSDAAVAAIIDATPERYRPLTLLAAAAGLRYSEVAVLRVEDVDWAACEIRITTAAKSWQPLIIGEPKSKKGKRSIAVDAWVIAELRAHIEAFPSPAGWLIPNTKDLPLVRPNFSDVWAKTKRSSHAPAWAVFHDLRHFSITRAARHGDLASLLARSGHATVEIGIRYQHRAADLDRAMASGVGDALRAARCQAPVPG